MSLLHPSRTGSPVDVWFADGEPARLVTGESRFRVIGEPKAADINGVRYWRVRARGADGSVGIFDLRAGDGGWLLIGVDDDALRAGAS